MGERTTLLELAIKKQRCSHGVVVIMERVLEFCNPDLYNRKDNDGEGTPKWFQDRVCVRLRSDQSTAVIREVRRNIATVEVSGGTKSVCVDDLVMIEPKEHDVVLVTSGDDAGVEGELVCI